ncbi:MAG: HAMP domain-containing sensor histidine kinase [Thermomicrobiales bacterium]
MKTLPVRFWLVLLTCAVITVPALTTVALAARRPPPPPGSARDAETIALQAEITNAHAVWADPAWQQMLRQTLQAEEVGVVLMTADGGVPFSYTPFPADEATSAVVSVATAGDDRAILLTARSANRPEPPDLPWYATDTWRLPLAQMAALLAIVAAIALFLYQAFLRPLSRLMGAMQRIEAGDLDTTLPRSRVTEVDQVTQAFGSMAAALRQALERQTALEQERRMTISAVAHDLRTPLFSLRGYLEGLAAGLADTPEKAARYVQVCRDKADALERLVADLFLYTRTEYLEQPPQVEPLDLAELLERLSEGLAPQAAAKGVELRLRANAPAPVLGDPVLLARALENLLDNAIRHTPTGGVVEIACWQDDGEVRFSIHDSGSGIAVADLPHIFKPLYRGEASRSRQHGGSGLGLTISQRLLRAHGGEITARNAAPGAGSDEALSGAPGGAACGAVFEGMLPAAPAGAPTGPAVTAGLAAAPAGSGGGVAAPRGSLPPGAPA